MKYEWKLKNENGTIRNGSIVADSQHEALETLRGNGIRSHTGETLEIIEIYNNSSQPIYNIILH